MSFLTICCKSSFKQNTNKLHLAQTLKKINKIIKLIMQSMNKKTIYFLFTTTNGHIII